MRVLVDYRPALRERTGVGEYVHELAKALVRDAAGPRDDRLTLFTSSWKDRPDAILSSEMPSARIVDVRVPVRALVWSWNRLEWPPVEWFAGQHDVVHSQSPLLIPARHGARVVTVHDLDFLHHPERGSAEIRRDYPALARSHAVRADAVVVSSQYAASQVTHELGVDPARVHLCPPGPPSWTVDVFARRHRAVADPHAPVGQHILFVGTLSTRKNVGTLLDAYARLRALEPAAPPLVLAGQRTAQSSEWEAQCQRTPLAGHVTMSGYVNTARRMALYEQALMLVLPSLEEGFGLPVLEAMACGVPVVVSNRGALPEVVGTAATPIDPANVEGFTAAMRALVDPARARDAAARGRQQAAEFSWATCAASARRAYLSAVEVHAHRH